MIMLLRRVVPILMVLLLSHGAVAASYTWVGSNAGAIKIGAVGSGARVYVPSNNQ